MKSLKHLLRDKNGDISILALIMCVLIVFVALAVYTGDVAYTNYYSAQLAMERSINSAVTEYMQSYEIKDVVVDLEPDAIAQLAADNMPDNGLTAQGNGYVLQKDEGTAYSIDDVTVTGTNEYVTMSGTFKMNMPWAIVQSIVWEMPIKATSRIIYISRDE